VARPPLWADVVVAFYYRAAVSIARRFRPLSRTVPACQICVGALFNGLRMRGWLRVGLSVVTICSAGSSTPRIVQTTNTHVIQSTHEYQYRQR